MPESPTFIDLPGEHLNAIGLVAVRWSELEGDIEYWVWQLHGIFPPQAFCLTTHMGSRERLGAMISLIELLFAEDASRELKSILKRFLKLINRRNGLVHKQWTLRDGGEPGQYVTDMRTKYSHGVEKRGIAEIKKLISDIEQLDQRLYDECNRLYVPVLAARTK